MTVIAQEQEKHKTHLMKKIDKARKRRTKVILPLKMNRVRVVLCNLIAVAY